MKKFTVENPFTERVDTLIEERNAIDAKKYVLNIRVFELISFLSLFRLLMFQRRNPDPSLFYLVVLSNVQLSTEPLIEEFKLVLLENYNLKTEISNYWQFRPVIIRTPGKLFDFFERFL